MSADVLVVRIALIGRAVAGFGLVQLALTEIDVGQLQVMMRLVEMMDVGYSILSKSVAVVAESDHAGNKPQACYNPSRWLSARRA